jgi:putative ABC transport system permease protein
MDEIRQDVAYAARSLARTPALATATFLILSLGIGTTALGFSVIDQLFLKPLPHVQDPSNVVELSVAGPLGVNEIPGTYPQYLEFGERAKSFSSIAAYGVWMPTLSLGLGEAAEPVRGRLVTASFFTLLGVHPALGRFFFNDEDIAGHPAHVVVLSYEFWKRHYGGDPKMLNEPLRLGPTPYTIIGVAPSIFGGVDFEVPDVWLPITAAASGVIGPDALAAGNYWIGGIARLKPGVSAEQALQEATTIYRSWSTGNTPGRGAVSIRTLRDAVVHRMGPDVSLAIWLEAACGVVLIIACANVANLLLARAIGRRREFAIRLALGATPARIVRQLLAECGLLSALGGAVAILVVAVLGGSFERMFLPTAPFDPLLSSRTIAFVCGTALLTTAMAGLLPAFSSIRTDFVDVLKGGGRSGSDAPSRARSALLVGQLALTLTLLACANLFLASLRHARSLRLGFDTQHLVTASLNTSQLGYTPQQVLALYERAGERVRSLPGIVTASLAVGSTFGSTFGVPIDIPGRISLPHSQSGSPIVTAVEPDYFRTIGARVFSGRAFTQGDNATAGPVALVNEAMASLYWPGESPEGKCFHVLHQKPCTIIVGVVENQHIFGLKEYQQVQFFVPIDQLDSVLAPLGAVRPGSALFMKTAGPAEEVLPAIRRMVQAVDPNAPYPAVSLVASRFSSQLRPWELGSTLLGLFAGLGLVLSATGLFGLLSYFVSQRTRELGIRLALGSRTNQLIGLIVGHGVRLGVVGIMLGVAGALVAGTAIASLLYEVTPYDPLALATVASLLFAVVVLVSYFAARRVATLDPAASLRSE